MHPFRPVLEAATDVALGFSHLPFPLDAPRVHAPGPNPDRLLLLGTAAVAGVGVTSHQLGVGGQLARRLPALTGRGVDVELVGSTTMTLQNAHKLLAERSLRQFGAVVLFLGSREGIGFQPMRTWNKDLRALLQLIAATDAAPHAFVVAVPPVYRYSTVPESLIPRMHKHLQRQNDVSIALCAQLAGATYLPAWEPPVTAPYVLGSAVYEKWAELSAPAIASVLTGGATRPIEPVNEPARQAALDGLNVIGSATDDRYDRIAQTARDLLGVSGASVTFLDHDRQWIKSAVSMSNSDTERAAAFCNTTIARPELFVVEDAAADDVFAGHAWVVGEDRVRFYAGYPVEAPNGERVGALCVVDTKPRVFTGAEAALLRELALRVQMLVWAGRTSEKVIDLPDPGP
jgi:lysophospholipase L1-like esterase